MNHSFKTAEFYRENLNKKYALFHRLEDRAYWDSLNDKFYKSLKKLATLYDKPPELLPLSYYLLYFTKSDRITYERCYFQRRSQLLWFAYMEAIENQGAYFYRLLDTLWAIMEETTWNIPAHYSYSGCQDYVPHEDISCVELFSSMTAYYVSTVYYIFKEKLDAISPEISNRIHKKIRSNVLNDFLSTEHWWMGFNDRKPNNWNPWNISNIVKTIINLEHYDTFEYQLLGKCAIVFDHYYSKTPWDGGCDEGAGYWIHAGGMVIEYLNDMYHLTNGQINLIYSEKVKNISEFLLHTFVSSNHLLGFSDLTVSVGMNWGFLYHISKCTGNSKVMALAKFCFEQDTQKSLDLTRASNNMVLYSAEAMSELPKLNTAFIFPAEHYYESVHIYVARQKLQPPFGLFLAAKSNHNKESHNHLDTGNYIVYKNEIPFIVDAGAKTYTAKTFSNERYQIWCNRSDYHNLPIIGGACQSEGSEYRAEHISCEDSSLRCNLEKAYTGNFIRFFVRDICMDRSNECILLKDSLTLSEEKEVSFIFITPAIVTFRDSSLLLLNQNEQLEIFLDHTYDIIIENILDDDERIRKTWGTDLKRIILTTKTIIDTFTFIMK